jgi:hypothetical protein
MALVGSVAASLGIARADDGEDEPRPRRVEHRVDTGVAIGRPIVYADRPVLTPDLRTCSSEVPVCVHARTLADAPAARASIDAFERTWATLTGALAVPPPDPDPGTLRYDVFIADDMTNGQLARTDLEARDVRSPVDRARGFTRIDRRLRSGCLLDTLAARSIARASLLRVAPATEEASAIAQSAYLASLAVPCSVAFSADEIATFQARSYESIADAHAGEQAPVFGRFEVMSRTAASYASGASAFWARIDWAFGRSPGALVTATWALHPTTTGAGGATALWTNIPDTFDVLRTTFKGALFTGSTLRDLFLDFGVARAFFGSADDGLHQPELRTLGDAARIAPDWDIPWPAVSRRLAARTGVAPSGASYLVVHHAGVRPEARLRVETEWEAHALFRWALVKLDRAGRELGRVVIPTTERATSAQMTLVDLADVDRILLVGVNTGDPAYGFDPDDEVWEPHGWVVTLAEE